MRSLGRGIGWHLSRDVGQFASHRLQAPWLHPDRGYFDRLSRAADRIRIVVATVLAALALVLIVAPAVQATTPSPSAQSAQLLRHHAPLLVLDAREPSGPVSVDAFLRGGARGGRARGARARVYGHAARAGARLWLQYWLFYPDNPQDRGIVRTGRHEGDWEMLQVGLGPSAKPQLVTFAQHHWRQGCAWREVEHRGAAPVVYVAHGSHATYPRRGRVDRPWPDPNDELRGDGARVRPPVSVITDRRPAWVASRMRWGSSRARWWIPSEQSSPHGPRFQDDGRWHRPAAYHAGARDCAAGAPPHPWPVYAIVALAALLALAGLWRLRRRRRARA